MDLTEIRKKAKSRKSGEEKAGPAEKPRATIEVQGVPGPPKSGAAMPPERPAVVAPSGVNPALDPLEALFARRKEIGLATEEIYLRGLAEQQDGAAKNECQWLTFALGKEEYALDIRKIREIIKPREITDIPRVPDFILGIISLRGIIIPVFDLKQRLRLGRGEITPDSRIVVCQSDKQIGGLLVDHISQVLNLPENRIEPPPAVLTGLDRELVEGVGRHQGRLMTLINLSNVLNAELV